MVYSAPTFTRPALSRKKGTDYLMSKIGGAIKVSLKNLTRRKIPHVQS